MDAADPAGCDDALLSANIQAGCFTYCLTVRRILEAKDGEEGRARP